eukprot:12024-Heterococcus_DN1.PRE.1
MANAVALTSSTCQEPHLPSKPALLLLRASSSGSSRESQHSTVNAIKCELKRSNLTLQLTVIAHRFPPSATAASGE